MSCQAKRLIYYGATNGETHQQVRLENGCIAYFGSRSIYRKHRAYAAHRYAYEVHYGPIPPGHYCLRSCDYENYINPAHLYTIHKDERWKQLYGNTEKDKVNAESVKGIRAKYSDGAGIQSMAIEYGIDVIAVESIVTHKVGKKDPQ